LEQVSVDEKSKQGTFGHKHNEFVV